MIDSELNDRLKKYKYRLGNVKSGEANYFYTQVEKGEVKPEDDEYFRKHQTGNKLAPMDNGRYTFDGWPQGKVVL